MTRIRRLIGDATGIGVLTEAAKRLPDELRKKSAKGRAGFIAATALSLARPAYEAARLVGSRAPSWGRTAVDAAVALTDTADGWTARKTGGGTAFGAVLDPLADKWPYRLREFDMARRGVLSPVHPMMRTARDVVVTAYRARVDRASNGHVNVAARTGLDPTSSKYSTVNYMILNNILTSPLGENMSRTTREVLATLTTIHVIATGAKNIVELRRELQRYQENPVLYIHEQQLKKRTDAPAPSPDLPPQS